MPARSGGRSKSWRTKFAEDPAGGHAQPAARDAALGIGLVLLLLGAPAERDRVPRCKNPFEVSAAVGWTTNVGCATVGREGRALRGPARILFGQGLELNRASASALEVLPGIGPVRAAEIVRARQRRPFRRIEDLESVHGIGPRTVAGLAGWVTVARDDG